MRSRYYRWGEDGSDGLSDDQQFLCFALALWNGRDPHWRELILFDECFHGDNGAGLGASHQTGWTGVIARILQMVGSTTTGEALTEEWAELLAYEEQKS